MPAASYRVGRFELQPSERRLLSEGEAVPLGGRSFDLLLALAERPGQLWAKDELLDRVWGRIVVEESNLAVHVAALRKILGAQAIENVAGHGYRLTLQVESPRASPAEGARKDNLPCQLTSFVGRDKDVASCLDLLGRTRLLTITGSGGLGKTRLALAVAQARAAPQADGAWLVDLAPLPDAQLVPQAIASVLGVADQTLDAVAAFVRDRRMLLVLDNCEHVLYACAHVAKRVLQAAPHLSIVATSREPLHVSGETIYDLEPLSVPDTREPASPDAIAGCDAVRLFIERAAAVSFGFSLTAANARAVAEVCARLDGVPLALELAAARARYMSVETMAQRLDQRFRLLRGGDRTAPARQQTLESTVDWSYHLLTADEQTLLHRLAVFAGGWTLDAAEAVGAGGDIETPEVVELQSRLVEKSLVVAEADSGRYRMLESIRAYAQARLEASEDAQLTKARHLAYFIEFARDPAPGAPGEMRLTRLNQERENLRSAFQYATRIEGGACSAIRLACSIGDWLCHNHFDLGSPILAHVLVRPEVQGRDRLRFDGLHVAAFISYNKGLYADARRFAEDALPIAREIGANDLVARALIVLANSCHGLLDRAAAREHAAEGLAAAREGSDRIALWEALNCVAEVMSAEGEFASAARMFEETLVVARELDSPHVCMIGLLNLGRVALSMGSIELATGYLREALTSFEEVWTRKNLFALLWLAAGLAAARNDWAHAARFFGASDGELVRVALHREPPDEAAIAPFLARAREALGERDFAHEHDAGRSLAGSQALVELRTWLAAIG
jgi:predicted ATPase/DNA-binding winged helix-turn-helix (wHTH) protein